jgi:hypothetical protein
VLALIRQIDQAGNRIGSLAPAGKAETSDFGGS